uniref:F-box protein At5g03100-like n=1 Tax=Erigeron canadensis TaxID=72917 RepID=UPI001CB99F15|nr:F-box protein At5g03100-like [Erigeron canadensis]
MTLFFIFTVKDLVEIHENVGIGKKERKTLNRYHYGDMFVYLEKKRKPTAVAMENVKVKEKGDDQPPKRIRTQKSEEGEEEEEDRISALPDCLIIDILSRLDNTKEAIQTGTLSKRWQHVWPSVPCLIFEDFDFIRYKRLPDFYLAVDKTLTQCQSNNLDKFEVFATYDKRFKSNVSSWIHFVTSRNVQHLDIFLVYEGYPKDPFVLRDDSFFVNSHFTRLDLGGCLFSPVKPISWNNLTHLTISNVEIYQDSIAKILSGSPLLDTLMLNFCYGYSFLDITSKSVKSFQVSGYEVFDEKVVVEINAPYISSLKITTDLYLWKILLRDVSSLVKADLDYHMWKNDGKPARKKYQDEMLNTLILNLRHVKELNIGIPCYEALARLEVKGFIFPSNLKGVDTTSHLYSLSHSKALVDCHDSGSSDSDAYDSDASDSDAYDSDSVESGDSEEPLLEEVN